MIKAGQDFYIAGDVNCGQSPSPMISSHSSSLQARCEKQLGAGQPLCRPLRPSSQSVSEALQTKSLVSKLHWS